MALGFGGRREGGEDEEETVASASVRAFFCLVPVASSALSNTHRQTDPNKTRETMSTQQGIAHCDVH